MDRWIERQVDYLWSATITHFITFAYTIATHWITKYLKQKIRNIVTGTVIIGMSRSAS